MLGTLVSKSDQIHPTSLLGTDLHTSTPFILLDEAAMLLSPLLFFGLVSGMKTARIARIQRRIKKSSTKLRFHSVGKPCKGEIATERISIKNPFLMNHFLVSKAEERHYEDLMELFLETASWLQSKGLSQWRHFLEGYGRDDVMQGIENDTTYIITKDDVLAGTVTISTSPDHWDKHIWKQSTLSDSVFVHRLAVKRTFSGHGLGGGVLRWMERELTFPSDKRYLRLDCVANNNKLNEFYVQNGYAYVGSSEDGHSKYQKDIHVI